MKDADDNKRQYSRRDDKYPYTGPKTKQTCVDS